MESTLRRKAPYLRKERVLVTGAGGKVGRRLLPALVSLGYSVRALTRGTPGLPDEVEVRVMDWDTSLDFTPHVAGCDAVVHLGADVWRIAKMLRTNAHATQALAKATVDAGVKSVIYTSSIAVYGSAWTREVTEGSPTISPLQDVRSECRGNASFRLYGRTKLMGELALRDVAGSVNVIVLRPTIIVDDEDIRELREMSPLRRAIEGSRRTHHIHIEDVVDGLLWSLERALSNDGPGSFETFNLSDDDTPCARYRDFFQLAFNATQDARYRPGVYTPMFAYNVADMLKNRTMSLRQPLGSMYFSPKKMATVGWRAPKGMKTAYLAAVCST